MNTFFLKYQVYIALFISVFAYLMFGYYLDREQFYLLLFLFTLAFFGSKILWKSKIHHKTLFKIGLLFRLLFLFSTPALSQDFYRFLWDGNAILASINPFQYKPNEIISTIATFPNANYLYQKMGSLSAAHFSNYPPINQLFFTIAALIGKKSILFSTMMLRIIIILADVGIYFYGKKLLQHFNQNPKNIFLYFLNPLVILELSGNLHFEGVMWCFFVIGLCFLIKNKLFFAAFFVAIAIATKLLPLLLLPLFFKYFGLKKSLLFYGLILVLNFLFFFPFSTSMLLTNYVETVSLWFINFEFNASIYYLIRQVGYSINGYNIIQTVGKFTPIISILIILFFAFFKKNASLENIIINGLMVLTLYFFIATTVHPWYIINLVLISVFTKYKFPTIWSFGIILSYYPYSILPFKENYFFIFAEYALVYFYFFYEIRKNSQPNFSAIK